MEILALDPLRCVTPACGKTGAVGASLDCECVNTNKVQVNISKTRIKTPYTYTLLLVALPLNVAGLVWFRSLY